MLFLQKNGTKCDSQTYPMIRRVCGTTEVRFRMFWFLRYERKIKFFLRYFLHFSLLPYFVPLGSKSKLISVVLSTWEKHVVILLPFVTFQTVQKCTLGRNISFLNRSNSPLDFRFFSHLSMTLKHKPVVKVQIRL